MNLNGKALHDSYPGNTASCSNSSGACLAVAVVGVIQEQLLRRPAKRSVRGLSPANPGPECQLSPRGEEGKAFHPDWLRYNPAQSKSPTWPQEPQSHVSILTSRDQKQKDH